MAYDATGRLYRTVGSTTTTFLYDGDQIVAEYDGSGNLQRRYVPGLVLDRPVVWLEGTSTAASNRRWLLTDEGGSAVAVATTGSGNTTYAINTYDVYGNGGLGNAGRFQYKGMAWIQEAGIYHARARAYDPVIGRFMQTDPIGYQDGMNWYAFAHNSPLDGSDPTGKCTGSLISNADDTCSGGASYIQGSGYSTKAPDRTLDQQKADYQTEMNDPMHKLMDKIVGGIAAVFTTMMAGPEIEMMAGSAEGGATAVGGLDATAANGTKVDGFTKHGMLRLIGDGAKRAGVNTAAWRDALENPVKITSGIDNAGRPFQIFIGRIASVVVNPQTREIVSMNPMGRGGVR